MNRENLKCAQKKELDKDLRCTKEKEMEVDYISMLPDHIIADILSRLTITEAARTSILSVRWRHLWRFFSGLLDFDGSANLEELEDIWYMDSKLISEERDKFRSWVDQVLKSLQNSTIEGLRICFDMGNESHIVDGWVQFAIQRKVKKLELDLFISSLNQNGHKPFVVPSLLNFTHFRSLHVLRLSNVDVSEELLEYFLSSCSSLETLAICLRSLMSLKVSNTSSLKQLEIIRCHNLKSLEISAKNLVSFKYFGYDISIDYKHIPNLREVSFKGPLVDRVFRDFFHLSSYDHSLLKVLEMESVTYRLPENFLLANLQHLELFLMWMVESGLHYCVSLMKICPSLCTLTLKMGSGMSSLETSDIFETKHRYRCLKEVNLLGFYGRTVEIELVKYILANATDLQKLLIDPIRPVYLGHCIEHKIRKSEDFTLPRIRARNIEAFVPPLVEFVIL